jgi:hypothetical protein
MAATDQFVLATQTFPEIVAGLHRGESPLSVAAQVTTAEIPADQAAALPGGSILLGLGEDGAPLLLDLYDPAPGPLLVAGDGGCGKTAFLQSLAQASSLQDPGEIQFGVLTPFPEEWTVQETLPNCLGIWPAYHPAARGFLSQLVSWAEVLPKSRQVMLLLVDGLELITANSFHAHYDLRWLLMHGPESHIWPVVAVNPGRMNHFATWLDYFQTHIHGQVKYRQTARLMVIDPEIELSSLLPGRQFVLSNLSGWQKFRLPVF